MWTLLKLYNKILIHTFYVVYATDNNILHNKTVLYVIDSPPKGGGGGRVDDIQ